MNRCFVSLIGDNFLKQRNQQSLFDEALYYISYYFLSYQYILLEMASKPQSKISNQLREELRIIKKLLTYRFKAQRYTFLILKEELFQIQKETFDALMIYELLAQIPFCLLDKQIQYLQEYIFSCKPTGDQQISSQHFLKCMQKMLDKIELISEQQQAKMINNIVSYVNKNYEKISEGFKSAQLYNDFKIVTLEDFRKNMSINGFNKQLIELLLEELSLESPTMNQINIDCFLYKFYLSRIADLPQDKNWLENIKKQRKFKQQLINSCKNVKKQSNDGSQMAKLSTNSEHLLKDNDLQDPNKFNEMIDNTQTNINLQQMSSAIRLNDQEQELPIINSQIPINSEIKQNKKLFDYVGQVITQPKKVVPQVRNKKQSKSFEHTITFKKKLFEIKKLLTYRLKAKRIDLYNIIDSVQSPCTAKRFIKFLQSQPINLKVPQVNTCLQYIYQDYGANKQKELPIIAQDKLQKFFDKMIEQYNLIPIEQQSITMKQIQKISESSWATLLSEIRNADIIKYQNYVNIMKKYKYSERQYELILQKFSLQSDNIIKINKQELVDFLIQLKTKNKKGAEKLGQIKNKKDEQIPQKFIKQPPPPREDTDFKTIQYKKQYKKTKLFQQQLRRMKSLITYRLKAQRLPFSVLSQKLQKKLRKLKQIKYSHAVKLFTEQPFYLTEQVQQNIIFKYIFQDNNFLLNSKKVSVNKDFLIRQKISKLVEPFECSMSVEEEDNIIKQIKQKVYENEQILRKDIQQKQTQQETMDMESFAKLLQNNQFSTDEIEICLQQLSLISDDMTNLLPEALFQRFLPNQRQQ